jgi:hypothetical protein
LAFDTTFVAYPAGEHLEIRQYERLSPLAAARRPVTCLSQLRKGDCVIAFSRREVHALRQQIEAQGRHRCCVVYGALPPDARQVTLAGSVYKLGRAFCLCASCASSLLQ